MTPILNRQFIIGTLASLLLLASSVFAADKPTSFPLTPIANMSARGPLEFRKDILPMLRKNCLACHGSVKPKADLNLENPPAIRKGGESGHAVIPGKGAESLIIKICGGRHEDSYMPPAKNSVSAVPLTSEELGLFKSWIDQGALGDASAGIEPLVWQTLPSSLTPINGVDVSSDGIYAACSRANQLYIHDIAVGKLTARPFDPALNAEGRGNSASRDIIQAVAFNPDGTLLASGGYRSVRLWRKQPFVETPLFAKGKPAAKSFVFHAATRRLVFGFADGSVEVWSDADRKKFWSFKAHFGAVNSLAFAADGALLFSASADRTIRVWNSADGAYMGEIYSPVDVLAVDFQNEKRLVVSSGADNIVRVWRLPTPHHFEAIPVREIKGGGNAAGALAFTRDAKGLLVGRGDNSLSLHNFDDGGVAKKADHGAPVTALALRSDAKRCVSLGGVAARLWNYENFQSVAEIKGDRAAFDARSAAERDMGFFRAEIEYYKNASQNAEKDQKSATETLKKAGESNVAALKDDEQKQEAIKKATAERDAAKSTAQAPADDLKKAAESKAAIIKEATDAAEALKAASARAAQLKTVLDRSAEARNAAEKAYNDLKAKSEGTDAAAKPTPDALKAAEAKLDMARMEYERNMAMFANADKAAKELEEKSRAATERKNTAEKSFTVLSAKNTEVENKLKEIEKKFNDADSAAKASHSAREVAEQTLERSKKLLKDSEDNLTHTRTKLAEFESALKRAEARFEETKKAADLLTKPLRAVAFSGDNKTLAVAGEAGAVYLFNAESGRAGERIPASCGAINALAFLDAERIAVAGESGCSILNLSAEWKLEREIGSESGDTPLAGRVLALTFSPDGKNLATGGGIPSRSGELKIWNVADGILAKEFKDAHSDTIFSVAFSADGSRIASCAADKFVRVFDVTSGKLVRNFEGHTHHALGVSWKRDSRTLASAGADRCVKIWDVVTGEQKKSYDGLSRKEMTSLRYVPSLNALLISGGEANLRLIKDDGADLKEVKNFGGVPGYIQTAAITPEGRFVVAGGDDSVLRVWDSTTGNIVVSFEAPK